MKKIIAGLALVALLVAPALAQITYKSYWLKSTMTPYPFDPGPNLPHYVQPDGAILVDDTPVKTVTDMATVKPHKPVLLSSEKPSQQKTYPYCNVWVRGLFPTNLFSEAFPDPLWAFDKECEGDHPSSSEWYDDNIMHRHDKFGIIGTYDDYELQWHSQWFLKGCYTNGTPYTISWDTLTAPANPPDGHHWYMDVELLDYKGPLYAGDSYFIQLSYTKIYSATVFPERYDPQPIVIDSPPFPTFTQLIFPQLNMPWPGPPNMPNGDPGEWVLPPVWYYTWKGDIFDTNNWIIIIGIDPKYFPSTQPLEETSPPPSWIDLLSIGPWSYSGLVGWVYKSDWESSTGAVHDLCGTQLIDIPYGDSTNASWTSCGMPFQYTNQTVGCLFGDTLPNCVSILLWNPTNATWAENYYEDVWDNEDMVIPTGSGFFFKNASGTNFGLIVGGVVVGQFTNTVYCTNSFVCSVVPLPGEITGSRHNFTNFPSDSSISLWNGSSWVENYYDGDVWDRSPGLNIHYNPAGVAQGFFLKKPSAGTLKWITPGMPSE